MTYRVLKPTELADWSRENQRNRHRIGAVETVQLVASRIYLSSAYAAVYALMILANMFLLVWLLAMYLGGAVLSPSFFLFEYFVTAVLGVEILLMMLTRGWKYFKKAANLFDLAIFSLCITNIYMFHMGHSFFTASEELDEIFESTLLIARYVVQCIRLFSMLKRDRYLLARSVSRNDDRRDLASPSANSIINFDLVSEPDSETGGWSGDDDDIELTTLDDSNNHDTK